MTPPAPKVRPKALSRLDLDLAVFEAGAGAGVAGRAFLVDEDEQGVGVAVDEDLLDVLTMAAGLALDPVLLPAAGPERAPPGRRGPADRLGVHPAHHQDLTRVVLLHHCWDQPGRVEGQLVDAHPPIVADARPPPDRGQNLSGWRDDIE